MSPSFGKGVPTRLDSFVVKHSSLFSLDDEFGGRFRIIPMYYYRAMHFIAKRGIAIACRLSVRPSVCLSVTLVNCDHIG